MLIEEQLWFYNNVFKILIRKMGIENNTRDANRRTIMVL